MSNHYHLLRIETPEANLSAGMRQLNGVYTQDLQLTPPSGRPRSRQSEQRVSGSWAPWLSPPCFETGPRGCTCDFNHATAEQTRSRNLTQCSIFPRQPFLFGASHEKTRCALPLPARPANRFTACYSTHRLRRKCSAGSTSHLQLLEIPDEKAQKALKGVMMEVDGALPAAGRHERAFGRQHRVQDARCGLAGGCPPRRSPGMEAPRTYSKPTARSSPFRAVALDTAAPRAT